MLFSGRFFAHLLGRKHTRDSEPEHKTYIETGFSITGWEEKEAEARLKGLQPVFGYLKLFYFP